MTLDIAAVSLLLGKMGLSERRQRGKARTQEKQSTMNGMNPQEGEENGGKKTHRVSSYDVGWTAVWASCLPMTFTGVWDTFTCPTEPVFRFVNLLPNQLQYWHSVTASPKECCREDTVISPETVPSYSSNTLQVPLCCSHISALHHTALSWRVPLRTMHSALQTSAVITRVKKDWVLTFELHSSGKKCHGISKQAKYSGNLIYVQLTRRKQVTVPQT